MYHLNKEEAPRHEREGLTSYVLLQHGDVTNAKLAVTWVNIEPGSAQKPHRHFPEQIYVVTRGRGRMHVGKDVCDIQSGDLVYIPPNTVHYAENTGQSVLTYVTAATPSFDMNTVYEEGEYNHTDVQGKAE